MMKNKKPPTPEYATSKTVVWWDMDHCPLPNGYEPSRIGPRIDTELKNLGYNGPLTIFAYGNLEGISIDFLRALSSTGIVIRHAPTVRMEMSFDLMEYGDKDHTPVTIMLISDSILLEGVTDYLCERDGGYNFLVAYPPSSTPDDPHPSSLVVCGEWLWDRTSLLKGPAEESTRLDKGSEEFSCLLCFSSCSTFEEFTEHLECSEHAKEIALLNEDTLKMFLLEAEEEAEARKQSEARKEAKAKQSKERKEARAKEAEARKQSKEAKKLETDGEDQMRSIPSRTTRQSKAQKLETEEEAVRSVLKIATPMAKKQSKAKKSKITGEYMADVRVLLH